MADYIVKSTVRDSLDKNVSAEFFDALDEKVEELLQDAERRADENSRKTVYAYDL